MTSWRWGKLVIDLWVEGSYVTVDCYGMRIGDEAVDG